jgi:hypothetical protein
MESSGNEKLNHKSMGKFKNITLKNLSVILQFISIRDNVTIILELNKKFSSIISKIYRKDNSLNSCLKEMKGIIKQTEEFKFITNNHCLNLEENLKKFRDSFNPFTFNRAVYLLSSIIFKDVQSLDLQKNNIGLDGVILLIPLIKKTNCLLHLNLSYNNISDEGCKFLTLPLKKNSSLQVMNLECNGISDGGVISLSDALIVHKGLKTIKLALNSVTFEGVKHLAGLLEKVQTQIMVIDFKYNNLIIRDDYHTDYFRKHKINF